MTRHEQLSSRRRRPVGSRPSHPPASAPADPPARADVVRLRTWLGAALLACIAAASPLAAQDVLPGIDVWTTPGGGITFDDFSANPLPPGFFGPGSDPFSGVVLLEGQPLPDLGPPSAPSLFPSDTVVERLGTATFPGPSTVPIEIKALSLVSSQPITVTFNGGQKPELWEVRVCLSSTAQQAPGTMIVDRTCAQGGRFSSTLPVIPKLIFTRQGGTATQVLDPAPQVDLQFDLGRWVYDPDFLLGVVRVPPGAVTDGDCDGVADTPLAGTSNMAPGVWDLTCDPECLAPPPMPQIKRLTAEEEMLAAHGVLPAQEPPPDADGDGLGDDADNCPDDFNPLQEDIDRDGVGDLCDNCVFRYNPCQEDTDGDGVGDVCEGEVFYDGFESGDTSAWTLVQPN